MDQPETSFRELAARATHRSEPDDPSRVPRCSTTGGQHAVIFLAARTCRGTLGVAVQQPRHLRRNRISAPPASAARCEISASVLAAGSIRCTSGRASIRHAQAASNSSSLPSVQARTVSVQPPMLPARPEDLRDRGSPADRSTHRLLLRARERDVVLVILDPFGIEQALSSKTVATKNLSRRFPLCPIGTSLLTETTSTRKCEGRTTRPADQLHARRPGPAQLTRAGVGSTSCGQHIVHQHHGGSLRTRCDRRP